MPYPERAIPHYFERHEMNIESIEKLLLLEMQVDRLDSTGLTRIKDDTEQWYKVREEITKNLTPIEKIMDLILVSVGDFLSKEFCPTSFPILIHERQTKIGKYRVDFLCTLYKGTSQSYVIECDGHDFHEKTKEQAQYDKQRERFLVSQGYKVLRYTGSEIINDFEKIKEELQDFFEKEYGNMEYADEK